MNAINWFSIPVTDLQRARTFYCQIMGFEKMDDLVTPMGTCAVFPCDDEQSVGGSLNPFMGMKPSTDSGISVWLNGGDDLQVILDRVTDAGGEIVEQKMPIGENAEYGYVATIVDSEGNRVGLHSLN